MSTKYVDAYFFRFRSVDGTGPASRQPSTWLASAGLSFWMRPLGTSWRRRAAPGGSPPIARKSVLKRTRDLLSYVLFRGCNSDGKSRGDVTQMDRAGGM